jgi:hypothetical protein
MCHSIGLYLNSKEAKELEFFKWQMPGFFFTVLGFLIVKYKLSFVNIFIGFMFHYGLISVYYIMIAYPETADDCEAYEKNA